MDLSRVVAGPFCTMQLGDLGAEIVKIESPSGDDARHMKGGDIEGEAPFFVAFNRNKKSIALDLRSAEGKSVVRQLIETSDILVENFRPGVMKRLGLDYEAVAALNPGIVYCSISAYGQTGPMASRAGFDPILQAEMGMMALNGEPDGVPLRHPLSISDITAGFYAVTAILAVLHARSTSGKGDYIDICLMDSVISVLSSTAQHYLQSGHEPQRAGNVFLPAAPATLFKTGTDAIYLSAITDKLFSVFCRDVLERADLLVDPRFETNKGRVANRQALFSIIEEVLSKDSAANWKTKMSAAGVPIGIVRKVSQALESEEVQQRGMVVSVDHPTMGATRILGTPFNFAANTLASPSAPPVIDQHRQEILAAIADLALRRASA